MKRRGAGGPCWCGGISCGEGKENAVSVAGAVCGVRVGAESEGVENALDVVLLDAGEEGFVSGGVVGHVCDDGVDVGSVDVFRSDELESAVAVCLGGRFLRGVKFRFPDHVADAVADEE